MTLSIEAHRARAALEAKLRAMAHDLALQGSSTEFQITVDEDQQIVWATVSVNVKGGRNLPTSA